jgi:hypothetical protein
MTPKAYLNLLAVILALLLVGAGAYGVWSYRHMAEQAAKVAPLQQQLDDLKTAQDNLAKEVVTRAQMDQAIRASRQNVTVYLDKAQDENPEARAYLTERIPDSVRDAYRQARAER